jgi:predicted TIM-barrel fold metal-dependent hydrolase
LIHQADPYGFFQPITPENEHYETLQKYPAWAFSDPSIPQFDELQRRCKNLIRNHPRTNFLLPHMANWPENLAYVGHLLDECPNVFIDFSARMDELGRQPFRARGFLITYQDRIYFGSDMPASPEMYCSYFRFLETFDEHFVPPDYDGTFGRHRWRIHGLGLPESVLKKIYHENALKLIPGLRKDWSQLSNGESSHD